METKRGISLLHVFMQFREKFACVRALVRACMEIDERDEKKRELRTRNVRVRLLARPALRGKQEDFPLSCTRARVCGALPYLKGTSSALLEGFRLRGLGCRSSFLVQVLDD